MSGPDEAPGQGQGSGTPPPAAPPEPDEPRVDEGGGAVVPEGGDGASPEPDPQRDHAQRAQTGRAVERSADDSDTGWGEAPRPDGDHESWLREQRPPHWD